jgi:hypothetical protein
VVHERPVVYFHIGGHKTGTTYLQSVLWKNRAALRNAGILYPGQAAASHLRACHDLRGAAFNEYRAPQVEGAWRRLVDEIRECAGSAVIDQEMFSLATAEDIARAMRDLAFADVHVVFTARDMARQLPAAWQEWIKNRSALTYGDYLKAVREPGTPEARRFMALQDVPAILARWAGEVPADRVHVVTVPPPGSDPVLLWQRFVAVLGIDPDGYDLTVRGSNQSLGAAEAAVLRRVNEQVASMRVAQPDYDRSIKFGLAPALAQRSSTRIGVPDDAFEWAVHWAQDAVQQLTVAGYPVTGELAELIPSAQPSGDDPDHADPDAQLSAAVEGITFLLGRPGDAKAQQVSELKSQLLTAQARLREHEQLPAGERIKRCVVELSDQVGWLGGVMRGYRRVRRRRRPE